MLSNYWGEGDFTNKSHGDVFLLQNIINVKTDSEGNSYREFIDYEIPFSKCELGRNFFYENKAEIARYGIENFYCPDWLNLTIQGNWYSPEYKVISLGFKRCKG